MGLKKSSSLWIKFITKTSITPPVTWSHHLGSPGSLVGPAALKASNGVFASTIASIASMPSGVFT